MRRRIEADGKSSFTMLVDTDSANIAETQLKRLPRIPEINSKPDMEPDR